MILDLAVSPPPGRLQIPRRILRDRRSTSRCRRAKQTAADTRVRSAEVGPAKLLYRSPGSYGSASLGPIDSSGRSACCRHLYLLPSSPQPSYAPGLGLFDADAKTYRVNAKSGSPRSLCMRRSNGSSFRESNITYGQPLLSDCYATSPRMAFNPAFRATSAGDPTGRRNQASNVFRVNQC